MPIEIKELVIRTVLESGTKSGDKKGAGDVEAQVKKILKKYRAEIVDQCVEAVSESLKRQQER